MNIKIFTSLIVLSVASSLENKEDLENGAIFQKKPDIMLTSAALMVKLDVESLDSEESEIENIYHQIISITDGATDFDKFAAGHLTKIQEDNFQIDWENMLTEFGKMLNLVDEKTIENLNCGTKSKCIKKIRASRISGICTRNCNNNNQTTTSQRLCIENCKKMKRKSRRRERRGLFNFLGDINKWLTGVATEEDLEIEKKIVQNRFNKVALSMESLHLKLNKNEKLFDLITQGMSKINDVLSTKNKEDSYQALISIIEHTTNLLRHLIDLALIRNLRISQFQNKMIPRIFNIKQIDKINAEGKRHFPGYEPVEKYASTFNDERIVDTNFAEVFPTRKYGTFIIVFPFINPNHKFKLYKIEKIAVLSEELQYLENSLPNYLAINNKSSVELPNLDDCKEKNNIKICHAGYPINHYEVTKSGTLAVFEKNKTLVQQNCYFNPIIPQPTYYSKQINKSWFFLFREKTDVIIECDTMEDRRTESIVGYLQLPYPCSLTTDIGKHFGMKISNITLKREHIQRMIPNKLPTISHKKQEDIIDMKEIKKELESLKRSTFIYPSFTQEYFMQNGWNLSNSLVCLLLCIIVVMMYINTKKEIYPLKVAVKLLKNNSI